MRRFNSVTGQYEDDGLPQFDGAGITGVTMDANPDVFSAMGMADIGKLAGGPTTIPSMSPPPPMPTPQSMPSRAPSAQAAPSAIQNPMIQEYMKKKLGFGEDMNQDAMKAAQASANDDRFAADMGSAGNKIGAAIAGVKSDTSFYDKMRDGAGQGVKDLQDLRKSAGEDMQFEGMQREHQGLQQDDDPNSEVSNTYRMLAKKMLPNKDFAGASATDLKRVLPSIEKFYDIQQRKLDKELDREIQRSQIEATRAAKAEKSPEMKQNQALATGFGKRMEQAEEAFTNLEKDGYDRTSITSGIGATDYFPNIIRGDSGIQQDQAERNFVNATLRRESGAAIADSEFESAEKQYFPRVGDGAETKAQKARNRRQVIESMKAEAGHAWDQVPLVGKNSGQFPRQVRKDGQVATVSSQEELSEAMQEGWK